MKLNKVKYFYYFIFCILVFTIFIYGGSFDKISKKLIDRVGASVSNISSFEEEKEKLVSEKITGVEEKNREKSSISSFESVENSTSVSNSLDYIPSTNNTNPNNNDNNVVVQGNINSKENQQVSSISEIDIISQNVDTLGTYGRLFIPSVNLNVALYLADMTTNEVQGIVNRWDSAAYFDFNNQNVIADHNHQGFHKIIDTSVGDFAYIKKVDGSIDTYRMTNKFEGQNTVYDLVDLNGVSALNGSSSLVMYTCYKMNEYDNHVMITTFQLVH